jgi:prepilin-type N-terminal cleavage/methylation domain-containing protein
METKHTNFWKRRVGFTLIELLVVIAIIGILAALITGLSKSAADKRKKARVIGELAKLQTVIDDYESKMGSYPPDNGNLVNEDATRPSSATNQLYYELAGATFNGNDASPQFTTPRGDVISGAEVKTYFKRDGIANSLSPKSYYTANENERKPIAGNVQVLVVPVDFTPGQINPWHYDSSSANRHNPDSYDLWAQIIIGGQTNIIGNWKE